MTFRVVELVMEDGASPFADWFDTLDGIAAAKVTTAIFRMERGNLSKVKWFRGIGSVGSIGARATGFTSPGMARTSFCCWAAARSGRNRAKSTVPLADGWITGDGRRNCLYTGETWR